MKKSTHFSSTIAAVFMLFLFAVASCADAREDTISCFQYSTSIELPSINSPQLAELQLTEQIYSVIRDDFADFRIVQNSNNGAVPVKIVKRKGRNGVVPALVKRKFTTLNTVFRDLEKRYANSHIIILQTGRMPITRFDVLADPANDFQYMLLGRSGVHAAGAEWKLLDRSGISANSDDNIREERVGFTFAESRYLIYAFIVNSLSTESGFSIESAYGTEYCAYFQVLPGHSYTLLTGYQDASSLSRVNTVALNRIMAKGGEPLIARVGSLVENSKWSKRGALTKDKMFILPVAVVTFLVTVLLLFFAIYSFVNRQKPIELESRPRFHVEK